jgi:hypothetical protein
LDHAIDWGRYAELYSYDVSPEEFSLDRTDTSATLAITVGSYLALTTTLISATPRQRGFGFSSSSSDAATAFSAAAAALRTATANNLVIPAAICTIPPRMRRAPRMASRTASGTWDS